MKPFLLSLSLVIVFLLGRASTYNYVNITGNLEPYLQLNDTEYIFKKDTILNKFIIRSSEKICPVIVSQLEYKGYFVEHSTNYIIVEYSSIDSYIEPIDIFEKKLKTNLLEILINHE